MIDILNEIYMTNLTVFMSKCWVPVFASKSYLGRVGKLYILEIYGICVHVDFSHTISKSQPVNSYSVMSIQINVTFIIRITPFNVFKFRTVSILVSENSIDSSNLVERILIQTVCNRQISVCRNIYIY